MNDGRTLNQRFRTRRPSGPGAGAETEERTVLEQAREFGRRARQARMDCEGDRERDAEKQIRLRRNRGGQ